GTPYALPVALGVPLAGGVSTDSRIAQGRTLVFAFAATVTSAGTLDIVDKDGNAVSGTTGMNANQVSVAFAAEDDKRYQVTLSNVNGVGATATASIGYLVGDVDADRLLTKADVDAIKVLSGETTSGANFRHDVNADGKLSSDDILAAKGRLGLAIP